MNIISKYLNWWREILHQFKGVKTTKVFAETSFNSVMNGLSPEELHRCCVALESWNSEDCRQADIMADNADKYLESVCTAHNFEPSKFCAILLEYYNDVNVQAVEAKRISLLKIELKEPINHNYE